MLIEDRSKLKELDNFLSKQVSNEYSELSKSCYFPKINRTISNLFDLVNIQKKEVRDYSIKVYNRSDWKLLHDPQTILLLIIARSFLHMDMYKGALLSVQLVSIRYYSNILHKFFPKYCDEYTFNLALERLSSKHLFKQRKTIGHALLYLARVLLEKHKEDLYRNDPEGIKKLIYTLRGRINQSVRSFGQKYYLISEESPEHSEYDESLERKIEKRSEELSEEITVYGTVGDEEFKSAIEEIKINKQFAQELIKGLSNPKYTDQLKLVFKLLLDQIKDKQLDQIIEVVKNLMKVKYTKQEIYFKREIIKLINRILDDRNLRDSFDELSHQSQINIRKFFAIYLGYFIYNNI